MRHWWVFIVLAALVAAAEPGARAAAALPETAAEQASEVAGPATPIPLRSPDADIRRRLLQLYGEIDGLQGVQVQVRGGVVTLSGTTLDVAASDKAEQVATRLAGVVSVENDLRAERNVERRLAPLIGKTRALLASILSFLPVLTVALLALAAFWVAGVLFTRRTAVFRRIAPNPFIEALFEQVVRLIFIVLGIVVAMSIVGATALIGTVLGAAGVIGLAVGFAVRDTIENYIASILLSIRQPFRPNDAVEIEGVEGRITTLNSRATIVTTWDGNEVRIPNAVVYKAKITNYTHTPERRFTFEVRVTFDAELSCALATALRAVRAVDGVIEEPGAATLIDRVEESGVVLKVLGWVDQKRSDFNKVRSEAIRAVKEALEGERITIGAPISLVRYLGPGEEDGGDRPTAASRGPTDEELRTITDTGADTTIKDKVRERRAETDNDLLTSAAPRE